MLLYVTYLHHTIMDLGTKARDTSHILKNATQNIPLGVKKIGVDCGTEILHSKDASNSKEKIVQDYGILHQPPKNVMSRTGLILTYAGTYFDVSLFNIFIRSLRATGSECKCVVIINNYAPDQQTIALAKHSNVEFVKAAQLQGNENKYDHLLQRFFHWSRYINDNSHKFDFIVTCDYDIGDALHSNHTLHVFGENPVLPIGKCSVHKSWYRDCPLLNGPTLLKAHGAYPRICAGFTIGTTQSYIVYLNRMADELRRTRCNDQGIHNMLIWQNSFQQMDVFVWDYWDGPVKHMDVGYLRDEYGRVLNEKGLPYCVIHQFKIGRSDAFVKELRNQAFALFERSERVLYEDTRFQICVRAECKGKQVHASTHLMIDQNTQKGFWGPVPKFKSLPISHRYTVTEGYRTAALFKAKHVLP